MLKTLRNAWKVKEIRQKLIFTFMMLVVIRFGSELPIPGVKTDFFANFFANQSNDAFGFFNAMTGGSFTSLSHRTAGRAAAVLAAAVALDRHPAAPLMAEGGQLLRLSDDTVFDRAAALALALLGAGRLFGDDPIAEGVGLADGVGAGGRTKILTSGEVSGILLKYPVQTILAGVAQWQRN